MTDTKQLRWEGPTLYANEEKIGEVRLTGFGLVQVQEICTELSPGIYRWTAEAPTNLDGSIEAPPMAWSFSTSYPTDYHMIPGVSYNGNQWGTGLEPKGFTQDGVPWRFAFHRTAVAGGTFSAGAD